MTETTTHPEELASALRAWQALERESMDASARLLEETSNPLVHILLEILRHDSLMHHRVLQFLLDSLTLEGVGLPREDLASLRRLVEEHDHREREVLARTRAAELREREWSPVQEQLLDYLIADEGKHGRLLGLLEKIKAGLTLASRA